MGRKSNTKTITVCAVMVSLSFILSLFPIFRLPNGGSITFASLAPIIIFSIKHKLKWGLISGVLFGLINLLLYFHVPPAKTFLSFFGVVIIDYILASSAAGLAGFFFRKTHKLSLTVFNVMLMRYICFVASGVLIWSGYVPPDIPVLAYSLIYNMIYIIPETIITYLACKIILKIISRMKFI